MSEERTNIPTVSERVDDKIKEKLKDGIPPKKDKICEDEET